MITIQQGITNVAGTEDSAQCHSALCWSALCMITTCRVRAVVVRFDLQGGDISREAAHHIHATC
jgi:hypothetical protein